MNGSDLKNQALYGSTPIVIPPRFDTTLSDSFDVLMNYITSSLRVHGYDKKIVYDWRSEGFSINPVLMMNKIGKKLVEDYHIPHENFYYICGAANVTDNVRHYQNCKKFLPYLPNNVFCDSTWESQHNNMEEQAIVPNHSMDPHRNKKFMCLNRGARPHRIAVLSQLLDRNLIDNCYLSFYEKAMEYETIVELFPNLSQNIIDSYSKIEDMLPFELTLTKSPALYNCYHIVQEDVELHQSSLFSLVTETLFFSDLNKIMNPKTVSTSVLQHNLLCFPCTLMSEKTFRTIKQKHPFVMLSTVNFLKGLRELGYKTFHPYINESYDEIEDDEERLIAVMNEVERLCNMNNDEIVPWLKAVHEITEFNYNHCIKKEVGTITKLKEID